MSLFFTDYSCLACWYRWTGQSGIIGTTMMGEVFVDCPKCKSKDIEWKPSDLLQKVPQSASQGLLQEAELQIKVYRSTPTAKLPTKAYDEDLGWDLYADRSRDIWLVPAQSTVRISTGLHIELPKGYGAVVKPRSSQGSDNVDIYAGVEDWGYRGEWFVCVHNSNIDPLYIIHGEKIGQFVLIKNPKSSIVEVQSLGQLSESERGQKGFGSSGK